MAEKNIRSIEGQNSKDMVSYFLKASKSSFREAIHQAWYTDEEAPGTKHMQRWLQYTADKHGIPLEKFTNGTQITANDAFYIVTPDPNSTIETMRSAGREVSEAVGKGNLYTKVIAISQRAVELERPGFTLNSFKTPKSGGLVPFDPPR